MTAVAYFVLGLLVILAAAAIFTNAVEWLGKRLNLSQGAVGSVLAAVGTALPETIIPVVAILAGGGSADSHAVGIGAILGAPFMLATLALFVAGLATVAFRRRASGQVLNADRRLLRRDLGFFLLVFPVALLASQVPSGAGRSAIAVALVFAYLVYVRQTLRSGESMEEHEVGALYLARSSAVPPMGAVILQLLLSLGVMVGGAHFFIDGLVHLATAVGIPVLLLALVITPVATELPEKFNSVLWIREGKDTLALGNITGAMVFQSSMVPALGIALTPWELDQITMTSSLLAILSGALLYTLAGGARRVTARPLMLAGAFYGAFILYILLGVPATAVEGVTGH